MMISQSHAIASPNAASAGHCAPPASGTARPSHEHTWMRYSARPSISLARLSASTIGPTPDIDTGGNATIATCVVRAGLDVRAISGSQRGERANGRTRRALLQAAGEELLEPLAARRAQHFGGQAFFFRAALMQEHHMVRHVARKTHFVGDDDHRAPFFREL